MSDKLVEVTTNLIQKKKKSTKNLIIYSSTAIISPTLSWICPGLVFDLSLICML